MPNFIDLFAGAGGLSEGFLSEGYHAIAHVEMNTDASYTLKTRACYYYLREHNQINQYNRYLRNLITRDELYDLVPDEILNTVINRTMQFGEMDELYNEIDALMEAQNIQNVDLIVGGPPCQAYSIVGRAVSDAEANKKDKRNFLYRLYAQVLNHYHPQMFIFENVPGLLTANNGEYFRKMQWYFNHVGYEIEYRKLNAADFSVLQRRERIIIIGWLRGTRHHYPNFVQQQYNYVVNNLLNDLPRLQPGETNNRYRRVQISKYLLDTGIRNEDNILTQNIARPHIDRDRNIYRHAINAWNNGHQRLRYNELPEQLCTHQNRIDFLDRFKVVAGDLPFCHTMMAHISKDGHYFIHPDIHQARSITVREAARIQSFPDNYFFEGSRTAAFTQIGNAVPPLMSKAIAHALLEQF